MGRWPELWPTWLAIFVALVPLNTRTHQIVTGPQESVACQLISLVPPLPNILKSTPFGLVPAGQQLSSYRHPSAMLWARARVSLDLHLTT
jgi:hypothetical protein